MEIEIYADVVCPWCYLGKHRLTEALTGFDGEVAVRFRPFQLDPRPVPEPRPLIDSLAERFGGAERVRQMFAQTAATAARDGLDLRFDRAVAANTFDAHRLVWHAAQREMDEPVVEALYRAHFTDGVNVGSRPELARIAGEAGLDDTEVAAFLDSDAGVSELRAELAAARDLGVTSVPTFVLAGKYAVTGAQEAETLRGVLAEVRRREAA
ncbi:DsbA family oxidoreductase [Solwaraspora sp. WMMD1047]|uniref:DsbA family oxidoreductase n=1 Tax=Solwaraspora sp. WMMD1047 TaxID=3016102 RepID=UPI0024161717|nr:DsbA family oxidoreductase [Solwaraspora sp. WMMD1047]MDG4834691.1 DsbA family oxidoreductase [Solwaraspora sp. WMMD1047]